MWYVRSSYFFWAAVCAAWWLIGCSRPLDAGFYARTPGTTLRDRDDRPVKRVRAATLARVQPVSAPALDVVKPTLSFVTH